MALAGFRRTGRSIHTVAPLAAVLTVGFIAALLLTVFALETSNAVARTIDVITRRIVLAVAVD